MILLRRPRLLVRLGSLAALIAAVWLLLVPRTALYYVENSRPYDIRVLYSWETTNQTILLPKELVDPQPPDGFVTSVRYDCGTAFTTGDFKGRPPTGYTDACAEVETPRRIAGLGLTLLGTVGLLGATKLSRRRLPAGS